jgi:hypothetical protein
MRSPENATPFVQFAMQILNQIKRSLKSQTDTSPKGNLLFFTLILFLAAIIAIPPEARTKARFCHGCLNLVRTLLLNTFLLLTRAKGTLVNPRLSFNTKANHFVVVEVQVLGFLLLPDPDLLIVVTSNRVRFSTNPPAKKKPRDFKNTAAVWRCMYLQICAFWKHGWRDEDFIEEIRPDYTRDLGPW